MPDLSGSSRRARPSGWCRRRLDAARRDRRAIGPTSMSNSQFRQLPMPKEVTRSPRKHPLGIGYLRDWILEIGVSLRPAPCTVHPLPRGREIVGPRLLFNVFGQVAERLKAHAWRACEPRKGSVGSNPTLSVRIARSSSPVAPATRCLVTGKARTTLGIARSAEIPTGYKDFFIPSFPSHPNKTD